MTVYDINEKSAQEKITGSQYNIFRLTISGVTFTLKFLSIQRVFNNENILT